METVFTDGQNVLMMQPFKESYMHVECVSVIVSQFLFVVYSM